MALNSNWPVFETAWGAGWNAGNGTLQQDRYVEVTGRTVGTVATARGRQYELDLVQAGTASAVLSNTDGALDPVNAAGPWAGHIAPYQPFRMRAQYPPTQNLLTQVQATGGDLGGYPLNTGISSIGQDLSIYSTTDSNHMFVSSGSAFQGSTVIQVNVAASAPISPQQNARILYTPQSAVTPGQTYTMQIQVRNVTPGTSVQVLPFIAWYDSTLLPQNATWVKWGTQTLTGSTTAAWTGEVVTATAPANAYGMMHGIMLAAVPSATCNIQADGWQLEKAATATPFTVPGITYPLYGGFVERWPSKWDKGGTYGVVSPTAVDAFALLSQRQLRDPLTEEIYSRSPRFLYTLGDPQNVSSFVDATGNNAPAPIAVSKYGAGSLTSGNQITATDPVNGVYTGGSGTVVSVSNQYPGTNNIGTATYISLSSAGVTGPANVGGSWSRMIAFRYTGPAPTSGNSATIWSSMGSNGAYGSKLIVQITDQSKPLVLFQGPGGGGSGYYAGGATNVVDGNWHMLTFGYNASTAQIFVSQDGNTVAYYGSIPTSLVPTGMTSDCIGAYVDVSVGNGTTFAYQGDIAFAAEFPSFIDSTAIANIYKAWKNSFSGDSSDARYSRILNWAGFQGQTDIGTGQTRSMGPASVGGQDALSALSAVVETEAGTHYVNRKGLVTFRGRGARYNNSVPVYTFGERTDLGEWPYEEVELDYDSTHLANAVTVTQASTSQKFAAQDTTSQGNYFPRTMSRTINSTNSLECADAANYLVSRYKNPLTRVQALKLHPSANPALWAVCLNLELNTRVRIMRRPFGAPPIQVDAFVEHIQWDLDDQNEAWVTLECSPVDLTPYGLFSSFRSTIYGAAQPVGTYGFPVGPMNGDNSQALAAVIGHGQQIVIEPGTANAEVFTVDKITATTPGSWSYGNLVTTTPSTKSHPAGSVVCEVLPTGVTDPTKYDASAKFDSAAFSY
jgi:hypothetical protein